MFLNSAVVDQDCVQLIASHLMPRCWQQLCLTSTSLNAFFKTSVLWGQARLPARNTCVIGHLQSRIQHLITDRADELIAAGEPVRELELVIEGISPRIGTSSLVNAFCGARKESNGEIRKRSTHLMVDSRLCKVSIKEKKCRAIQDGLGWRGTLNSATPFSGAFYEQASSVMIAIDLAGGIDQLKLLEAKLRFFEAHGAGHLPKILVGTRHDLRCCVDEEPISYDAISQFCNLYPGIMFVETSAARTICETLQNTCLANSQISSTILQTHDASNESKLVDYDFKRSSDDGTIPIQDCDHPFLLAVMMGIEPDFTTNMIHTDFI